MKKILILMPIDPITILTESKKIIDFCSDKIDWYSPQILSFLDAEHNELKYMINNILFSKIIKDNFDITLQKNTNYDCFVMFGNCDKDTIKFDHIITIDDWWENKNKIDYYIDKISKIDSDKVINWFTSKDIEYSFPTFRHLKLFLKTLGGNNGV